MANVYTSDLIVPAIARNNRDYHGGTWTGGTGSGNTIIINNTTTNTGGYTKEIISFTATATPEITDYTGSYATVYGQFPTISLYTYDEDDNLIQRTEKPKFIMGGVIPHIVSIIFDLGEPATGFIILS